MTCSRPVPGHLLSKVALIARDAHAVSYSYSHDGANVQVHWENIFLGDCVLIKSSELHGFDGQPHQDCLQVTELFQDIEVSSSRCLLPSADCMWALQHVVNKKDSQWLLKHTP